MAALSLGGKRSSATFASGAPRSATCRRERAPVASRLLLVVHTGSEAAVGEGARRLLHSSRSSRLDLRSCWSSEPTLSSARVRDARSPPGAATRASVGLPRLRSRTSADAHLTAPPPAADPWGGPPDPLRYQLQGAGSTHGQVGPARRSRQQRRASYWAGSMLPAWATVAISLGAAFITGATALVGSLLRGRHERAMQLRDRRIDVAGELCRSALAGIAPLEIR